MDPTKPHAQLFTLISALCLAGCASGARVQLAAADSVDLLGEGMARTLAEYHEDLVRFDEERQRAAVRDFIERIRTDINDENVTRSHAEAFQEALQRLDADHQAAWQRYSASLENVATLQEIAAGLRRQALESIALDDEVRRYFGEVMQRRREMKEQEKRKADANGEDR